MATRKVNRRSFLKAAGIAGVAAVTGSAFGDVNEPRESKCSDPNAKDEQPIAEAIQVPKRKLGKTGIEVPILALGGSNFVDSQVVLRKAYDWGVRYWDTANRYANGNSELGIGMFLEKNPELRKDLFIVTKADHVKTAEEIEKCLQLSLERMKTDYIDMYFGVHGMDNPRNLTDELKTWAEGAKKRGIIRAFGFSTHSNTMACLEAAAKCGWIDGVMTSYNYRLMKTEKMQAAVEACHKAEVGLVAMKTQGMRMQRGGQREEQEDEKVGEHFLAKGYTQQQAKLKIVWEDERIASACSRMDNLTVLMSNVAAAIDKTQLDESDKKVLAAHAVVTCSGYCAACDEICASATGQGYVSDVMRCLMYYNSYGDSAKAKEVFTQIPSRVRSNLLNVDYRAAEARCPQHLPIAALMKEAVSKLA